MQHKLHLPNFFLLVMALLSSQLNFGQCTEAYALGGTPLTGSTMGQSFTTGASCSGYIDDLTVEITTISQAVNNALVTLYAGNGDGGTNLGSLSGITLLPNQTNTFDFSALGIALSASTQYTFTIDKNQGGGQITYDGNSSYSGGDIFFENSIFAGFDIIFNVSLSATLSLEAAQNESYNLKIHPNPSDDFIKVLGLKSAKNYTIYNILGTSIRRGAIEINGAIGIEQLTSGIYFIRFENGSSLKFIKN